MGAMIQSLARLILVVINLILLIVSLVLAILGFLLKYSSGTFSAYTQPVLDEIHATAKTALGDTVNTDEFDLGALFGPFAIILIVIGFMLLTISSFGCIGACCGVKSMLMMYTIILSVLVLGQIVFVVMFFQFSDTIKAALRPPLQTMLSNYHGLNGTAIDSLAWNFLMIKFECCGIDSADDFQYTNWFGLDHTDNWIVPLACCKGDDPTQNSYACAKNLDDTLNNHNAGCLDTMWNVLVNTGVYMYLGATAVLLFQIILIVFALVLYCKRDENKTSPEAGRRNRPQW